MTSSIHEMLESLVDPVFVINQSGIVLEANPSACSLFGWKRDELIGDKINVLMGEPYRTEHDSYLERHLETGETRAIGRVRKVLGRHRSGDEFPCELSVSRATEDGELRFYGIVRDISDREAMAAKLAQIERLAAMGELAAGVAHEVNNPVNTIINCAQLVKDGDDDPRLLDDIIQEGMRIAMIVRDLLEFARDSQHEKSPIEVGIVVRRVLSLVSRRLERQGIDLRSEIDDDLPMVRGIPHQIQQVILNLLLNARDALVDHANGEHAPRIEVRARMDGPSIRITVRDNGPGVSTENRDRIFEPFFTTKKTGDGTGLGLAVSRGIVNEHDGTLSLESEPGEFAEFRVSLPTID